MSQQLEILQTGPLSTIQDLGRPGHSASGVPESGALDLGSLRLANRLVGNDQSAAAIEATFGGLCVRAHGNLIVAITGAIGDIRVDGRAVDSHRAVAVRDGGEMQLKAPNFGVRSYLAVRGGIEGSRIYGSLSTDLLSGLGMPLQNGELLPIGRRISGRVPPVDVVPFSVITPPKHVLVRATLGPRDNWFSPEGTRLLTAAKWKVDARSNRVGLRLVGPDLRRCVKRELPSEGMMKGAIQVPSGGQPIVFLSDHPVTGGYPVIAVVVEEDLGLLAQCGAGQTVRIAEVDGPLHRLGNWPGGTDRGGAN